MRDAVFLSGAIGSGKSTLGRALAERIGGRFIEGDDFGAPERRWFQENWTVSQRIVSEILAAWEDASPMIVARPLRSRDWVFFRHRLSAAGGRCWCVSLDGDAAAILDPARGRIFSEGEARRSRRMIDEGYGRRSFSDAVLRTDRASFEATLAELERLVAGLRTSSDDST